MSAGQAATLRKLSIASLSRLGYSATADHAVINVGNGKEVQLESLSRMVALAPERQWKPLVRAHFAAVDLALRAPRIQDLPPSTVLGYVRAKVCEPAAFGEAAGNFSYGLDQSGLKVLAVMDGSHSLLYLTDQDMERLGHDAVWSAAIGNFFNLGVGVPEQLEGRNGAFFCVEADHSFQSTWLAFPDELFERLGFTVGVQGALLTAPASSIINIHIIGEGTTAGDLDFLLGASSVQYNNHPAPFSPHVYWWDGFAVHQISSLKDGGVGLRLPEMLEAALNR
ncbi:hypothetical protein [Arthrobacter sp. M4]|uniref:hypothetical protein n=1 Tax=Arthrobacter sp. M4 TaxID=218160 RepID=UPI001CDC5ED8|nr:hypothetical protein [Arthrobacter sp. M4]MCA4135043.1 hypothetical protein [Arthrobacter sp. M4]